LGGACSTYGEKTCVQVYGEELKEKHYLEDVGMDGRIILKWIVKK
jgi:hypothetical protein